jgi:MOSC domain-containing protein YiiM
MSQDREAAEHGVVVAVSRSTDHEFSKSNEERIELVAGLGVAGDAHLGEAVQHLSRVAHDPTQPNLRQVHLLHAELLSELFESGFDVSPGRIGENVTTRGIDLLVLPRGARLRLGGTAVVELAGLRNPCRQLDDFAPGLMAATLEHGEDGELIRKAGVMAVVVTGGVVRAEDAIHVELPAEPHRALEPV